MLHQLSSTLQRWFWKWVLMKKIMEDVLNMWLMRIIKLIGSKFMFLDKKIVNLPIFLTTF
jgi:hypothetical protein